MLDTPPDVGLPWPDNDSDEIVVAVATHEDAVEVIDGERGAEKYAVLTVAFYRNRNVVGYRTYNPRYNVRIVSRLPDPNKPGDWLNEWETHYEEEFKDIATAMTGMSKPVPYGGLTRDEKRHPRPWIQGFLNIRED